MLNNTQQYADLTAKLNAHGQRHLLAFYDLLNEQQKGDLLAQIEKLDLDSIDTWIAEYVKNDNSMEVPSEFSPAPSFAPIPASDAQREHYGSAAKLGIGLISAGKVAGFVVAGGQGTRLGFDGPKGNYPISPIKNKTLFQIFAEGILAASKKYSAAIPWYIMTNPLNHSALSAVFDENGFHVRHSTDLPGPLFGSRWLFILHIRQ